MTRPRRGRLLTDVAYAVLVIAVAFGCAAVIVMVGMMVRHAG